MLATARTTRRTILGGILLGLAIATKMTPALTLPALLRRRWVTVALAAGSAFAVVYLPHVLRVGGKVIGFLPGYLQQENYTTGTRYGIIGLFITGPLASAVAVLILAAVALAVLQFSDPDRPWQGALMMTAAALAVATPHYQWYSLLLVMLVALDGRPEWLAFAAGGYYAAEPDLGRYNVPGASARRHRLRRAVADRGGRLADPARAGRARGAAVPLLRRAACPPSPSPRSPSPRSPSPRSPSPRWPLRSRCPVSGQAWSASPGRIRRSPLTSAAKFRSDRRQDPVSWLWRQIS